MSGTLQDSGAASHTAATTRDGTGIASTSRRTVIGAALAGLVALMGQALGRPPTTLATDPNDLALGVTNNTTETTTLLKSGGGVALDVQAANGPAVNGVAINGSGWLGVGGAGEAFGVAGGSESGAGVTGWVGSHGRSVPLVSNVGVRGYAAFPTLAGAPDPSTRGVVGEATAGTAIDGIASQGVGVHGQTATGTGVLAESPLVGTALKVVGRAEFANRSGLLVIRAGHQSARVQSVPINAHSIVLATLQQSINGIVVQGVRRFPASARFDVYLNHLAPSDVTVGWFVLG